MESNILIFSRFNQGLIFSIFRRHLIEIKQKKIGDLDTLNRGELVTMDVVYQGIKSMVGYYVCF